MVTKVQNLLRFLFEKFSFNPFLVIFSTKTDIVIKNYKISYRFPEISPHTLGE